MKVYKFSNGFIGTEIQAIDSGMFNRGEVKQVPSAKYNRRKYNRMNNEEQEEYDAKRATLKPEYRLFKENSVFTVVTKTAFNYFDKWLENQDIKNNPSSYCNVEALAHLF